jgi:hypothetical protein
MTDLQTMLVVLSMGLTPEEIADDKTPYFSKALSFRKSEIGFAMRMLTGLGLLEEGRTSKLMNLVKRKRKDHLLH